MPWKDIEKRRAAVRRHYYANRHSYIEKAMSRKERLRDIVRHMKKSTPCKDCQKYFPYYVMDFDHVGTKQAEIGKIINTTTSLKQLKAEIAQCEIICSNCHRVRTHNRLHRL